MEQGGIAFTLCPGRHSKVAGLLFNCLSLSPLGFFFNVCVLLFKMRIKTQLKESTQEKLRSMENDILADARECSHQ